MSKSTMVSGGWQKSGIAMLLSCLSVCCGPVKFCMGALCDKMDLRKLFAGSLALAAFCWRHGGGKPVAEGLDALRTMHGEAGESNVASDGGKSVPAYWQPIAKYVFCNPMLLLAAAFNVALYFIGFGAEDWMPVYLRETAKMSGAHVKMAISMLAWSAISGVLVFAWLAAKYPGKMAQTGGIGLFMMAVAVLVHERITATGAPEHPLLLVICGILGALAYAPQPIAPALTINAVPLNVVGAAIGFAGVTACLIGNGGELGHAPAGRRRGLVLLACGHRGAVGAPGHRPPGVCQA